MTSIKKTAKLIMLTAVRFCGLVLSAWATMTYTYDSQGRVSSIDLGGNVTLEYTYDENGNRTERIYHKNQYFTITASAGPGGTVSLSSPSASVQYADSVSVTITPDSCHTIDQVVVDGNPVGRVSSYSFHEVTANHTLQATFRPRVYSIATSVNDSSRGTITPDSPIVDCGDSQTFNITPNTGYGIVNRLPIIPRWTIKAPIPSITSHQITPSAPLLPSRPSPLPPR